MLPRNKTNSSFHWHSSAYLTRAYFQPPLYLYVAMHFFPCVSVILATAALVTSEPSAQLFEPFDVAALDGNTFFTDTSYVLIQRSYQHLKLTIRLEMMEIWQAFLHRRQRKVHPGLKLRHNKAHKGSNNKAHLRGLAHMGSRNNKAHLRRLTPMGSSNKAYLRMGAHPVGNSIAHPRARVVDKTLPRRSSHVPLLVFKVTNTVENMEDVLLNATRVVCVGSGARMPSVILQFTGNRLLVHPNSHV